MNSDTAMLYFSGTGNSKVIAKMFSKKINGKCYSIEEKVDFQKVIERHDVIAFCYPIYGSCVPRIMREFVAQYVEELRYKKLIIFCTQLIFSGDGAYAFTKLLPKGYGKVIYAEHFNMPNNICNIPLFSIKNGEKTKKYVRNAEKKMDKVCKNIKNGIIKKRGFNGFSHFIGKSQSAFWPALEEKLRGSVCIDSDCVRCGACTKMCPVKNLTLNDKGVEQKNNCIFCYRCVNGCPKKAITVLINEKPKTQYKGIDN